jgi:ABC-type dipeptide/oligopeptide/nickel transport system permease component
VVWYNLSLGALIVSLVLTLTLAGHPRLWARARFVAVFALRASAVLMGSWLLVTIAARASTALVSGGTVQPLEGVALVTQVLAASGHSVTLMAVAVAWGTSVGLGMAYWQLAAGLQRVPVLWIAATLLWVTPTFLLGVFAQEAQAQIFQHSGYVVTGGYGTGSALQTFWAGLVLGIRPAAYVYRHSHLVLTDQAQSDHVRTAVAKGMPWRIVAARHIFRPSLSTISAGWLNSFRLMIGSLPLIEWFFAFPGLGNQLIYALGIARPDQVGHFQPDLAIALVVAMGIVLVLMETGTRLLQQLWDPRINDLRAQPA